MNFQKTTMANVAAALVACATVATGCASAKIGPGIRPEQPIIPGEVSSEVTKADATFLTAKVCVSPEAVPAKSEKDEDSQSGRVKFSKTEKDDAAELASFVQTAVEGALIGNGFTIANKKPDIVMEITVRQRGIDKSGEFYLLEGSVPSAKVLLPNQDSKAFATRTFPSVRGSREFGKEKAIASLADKLAPAVGKWTAETVKPADLSMAAITVVIQRNTIFYKSKDPIYVNKFAERLMKIDGIYYCELLSGEVATRLWEFRIVYDKLKFPGGVVNKVIETCKDLDIELHR